MDDPPRQGLDEGAARLRALRREIEEAVLPLATSVDGRRFTFQARLHELALETGGYVALEDGGVRRLGQVLAVGVATEDALDVGVSVDDSQPAGMDLRGRLRVQLARGEGIVLGGDNRAFHGRSLVRRRAGRCRSGSTTSVPGGRGSTSASFCSPRGSRRRTTPGIRSAHVPVRATRSGKTYALGLVLEQLLPAALEPAPAEAARERALAVRLPRAHANELERGPRVSRERLSPTLLARAAAFGLGQSLVAGKIATHPALVRFGARLSEEGGADVAAAWAALRS